MDHASIDQAMIVVGNVFNLLVVAVFLTRAAGFRRTEWVLGLMVVVLALPAGAAAIANIVERREWWTIAFPLFLFCYCVLELVVDYILRRNVRTTWFVSVYLVVFYVAAIAMVGYSFGVHKQAGFLTLSTYLLGLAAAWYSYFKVRHGEPGHSS